MSFIRLPLALLLLLSTSFVCYRYTFKMDLTSHDVVALTKASYNDSDSDWVRYLSARDNEPEPELPNRTHRRKSSRRPSSKKTPPPPPPESSGPSCDIGLVTQLWDSRDKNPIKYGQMLGNELVYPVLNKRNKPLIIRVFGVNNLMESHLRGSELRRLIEVRQFVTWGREVIRDDKEAHKEVWFVVQKKKGDTAEFLRDKLGKKYLPNMKAKARDWYRDEYHIELPDESKDDDDRYVYWEDKETRGWYGEIVGWYLDAIMPILPEAEKLCIISRERLKASQGGGGGGGRSGRA